LAAVASKTPGRAAEFAKIFNAERYYEDYQELVKDESLDVIYVATTHNFHYEHALLCLENKKPSCAKNLSPLIQNRPKI